MERKIFYRRSNDIETKMNYLQFASYLKMQRHTFGQVKFRQNNDYRSDYNMD